MTLRKLFGKIHLILGLGTGILFFVIALSGALYSWEPELSHIIYHQQVKEEDKPYITISDIKNTLQKSFPEGDFRTALYRDKGSTIEVLLYIPGTYYHAQLNPYTAELIHLQDMKKGWLNNLKNLHRNLLLGPPGREVVHWITLAAMLMLITGLVIWWPISGKPGKNKFSINWTVSPKKLNYDLHNILGFYSTWVLIFIIGTGVYWGFAVVKDAIKDLSGEKEITYEIPLSKIPDAQRALRKDNVLNQLVASYQAKYKDSDVRISIPHQENEAIQVSVLESGKGENTVNHYFHDQYNGEIIQGKFANGLAQDRSTFSTINGLAYEIHFGSVWGLPGRILASLASLIGASLPITGFLVWFHKRKMKTK